MNTALNDLEPKQLWQNFAKICEIPRPSHHEEKISSFIKKCSIKATKFQSGFIYQYAFVMLLGFSALLTFLIVK